MMKSYRIVCLLLLIILLAACAMRIGDEKLVERSGKGRWRQDIGEGVFVGVSRHGDSQAEAVADATLNARMQIAESLGLRIEVETLQQARDSLSGEIVDRQIFEDTRSRVYASALIEVEPDRVYWEKWMRMTEQGPVYTWKAWVRAPFSRERHEAVWLGFVRRATETYAAGVSEFPVDEPWTDDSTGTLFSRLDALLQSEEDFAGQLWLVNRPDYRRFLDVKQVYAGLLRDCAAGLSLYAAPPRDIFDQAFPLAVLRDNRPTPFMPMFVSIPALQESRTIYSDDRGEATAPYRIHDDVAVTAHVQVGTQRMSRHFADVLPKQEIRLLSPRDKGSLGVSIWLFTDPEDPWLRDRLRDGMNETGYNSWQGAGAADYRVEGKLTAHLAPRSANLPDAHVAESRLELQVVRDRDRTVVMTYSLPNERYYDTRGFGRNQDEALQNSLRLANMGVREECVRSLVRRIDRAITDDVTRRLLRSE